MKKSLLSYISDIFLITASGIIISAVFSRIFLRFPYNVVFGIFVGLSCLFLSIVIKISKYKKIKRQQKLSEQKKEVLLNLNFATKQELDKILEKALSNADIEFKKYENFIYLPHLKYCVFIKMGFSDVKKSDVVYYFNNISGSQKCVIVSASFTREIIDFSVRFNGKIILFDGEKIFNFLNKYNALPEKIFSPFSPEKPKKLKLSNFVYKKNAKKFLAFGLLFLAFSFIVPIKTYYIIVGSVMLLFSLTVFLFGKKTETESEHISD